VLLAPQQCSYTDTLNYAANCFVSPSATEMACALGLEDQLVGITHECDYPAHVKTKPVVVRNVLPIETMSQSEIDRL
jgi:ABC-type hemin transport system substrate-binding protein